MNARISQIVARQVFDSRGTPTVEVEITCSDGSFGRALVPSGASTGIHEALELRDGDVTRFGGKGVAQAIAHVREIIAPQLLNRDPTDQEGIDHFLSELDGTPNKSRLGANAILGVSLAVAHVAAAVQRLPLWRYLARDRRPSMPMPMVNLISGGMHAGNKLDFQDFLLLPIGASTYSQALEMTWNVYHRLRKVLKRHCQETALVADEGGFGPQTGNEDFVVDWIMTAIREAGYRLGTDAALAIDVASSRFYDAKSGHYRTRAPHISGSPTERTSENWLEYLTTWVKSRPILSVEDGMAEDDWSGWQRLTQLLGDQIQLIGDDLFVTNPERLQRGIHEKIANAVLVKVNQIGTLTETFRVIDLAHQAGYRTIISARSGETEDTTIADLAVATGAGQIKIGSITRSERLAKYNQLLRIEEQLPGESNFAHFPRR